MPQHMLTGKITDVSYQQSLEAQRAQLLAGERASWYPGKPYAAEWDPALGPSNDQLFGESRLPPRPSYKAAHESPGKPASSHHPDGHGPLRRKESTAALGFESIQGELYAPHKPDERADFRTGQRGGHSGKDTQSGIGPDMVPSAGRQEWPQHYPRRHAGMDTASNLSSGVMPTEKSPTMAATGKKWTDPLAGQPARPRALRPSYSVPALALDSFSNSPNELYTIGANPSTAKIGQFCLPPVPPGGAAGKSTMHQPVKVNQPRNDPPPPGPKPAEPAPLSPLSRDRGYTAGMPRPIALPEKDLNDLKAELLALELRKEQILTRLSAAGDYSMHPPMGTHAPPRRHDHAALAR